MTDRRDKERPVQPFGDGRRIDNLGAESLVGVQRASLSRCCQGMAGLDEARSFLVQNWCGRWEPKLRWRCSRDTFVPKIATALGAQKNGRTRRRGRSDAGEALDLTSHEQLWARAERTSNLLHWKLARGACPQAFRVTRPPIAGSDMLSRPVSTCPASRYSKLGSSATVTTRSYQPWNCPSDSLVIGTPVRARARGSFSRRCMHQARSRWLSASRHSARKGDRGFVVVSIFGTDIERHGARPTLPLK